MLTYYIYNPEEHLILPDGNKYYNKVTYRNSWYLPYFEANSHIWKKDFGAKILMFSNNENSSLIKTNSNNVIRYISNKGHLTNFLNGSYYYLNTYKFNIKDLLKNKIKFYQEWNPEIGSLWFLKKIGDLTYGGYDVFAIRVNKDMETNINIILTKIEESNKVKKYSSNEFILQKGVENPKTIDSRKYDIRAYGLMVKTKSSPYFGFYLFDRYMIRKSIDKFDPKILDPRVMLTNTTFGSKVNGIDYNKLTNVFTIDERPRLYNKIFNVFCDLANKINKNLISSDEMVISIIGMDYIFDVNENIYLLEINKSPTIHSDPELIKNAHKNMEHFMFNDEFFKITFDAIINDKLYEGSMKHWFWVDSNVN